MAVGIDGRGSCGKARDKAGWQLGQRPRGHGHRRLSQKEIGEGMLACRGGGAHSRSPKLVTDVWICTMCHERLRDWQPCLHGAELNCDVQSSLAEMVHGIYIDF